MNCPKCNKELDTPIKAVCREEGLMIIVRRKYVCDCGEQFITSATYLGLDDEAIEEKRNKR